MQAGEVDVLICGSGSAGLCAAIWLARFGVNYKVLESRNGPLDVGQADGVQCRTVEVFESLGISESLLKESYHVMELAFWSSDGNGTIQRRQAAPDTESGLSHQPHVILNQARINGIMIDEVKRLRGDGKDGIEYGCQVDDVHILRDTKGDADSLVEVKASKAGVPRIYRAKYVLGCDGAHSTVRKSLGFRMLGDSTDAIWGVMDVFPRTDFPDIRKKSVLQSDAGNLVLIPREGDAMVRLYIELPDKEASDVTLDTHSPKAGQGMNVSLQDGYNIGWKLGLVLTGRAPPQLLETYVSERQQTATELIEFDRYFTKLFSTSYRQENGITAEHFREQFLRAGRYTAGLAIKYGESSLVRWNVNAETLASGVTVGMRFPTAMVVRLCDARPMQLVRALPADGRWHLVVFGGNVSTAGDSEKLKAVARGWEEIIRAHTPTEADPDSVIRSILVLSSGRASLDLGQIPDVFKPITGPLKMRYIHGVFVDSEGYNTLGCGRAFESYGVDPTRGAVVIVRPDQYVAQISALEEVDVIRAFFDTCLLRA
ncbi:putative phenol 2-monooxygenase protein [Eutypa lata UCREL1]|uniref:Putative phenol 2-monooxygenase protein n=1 Tax=Eutypa lata (strain UCR-EL1) TaxID=1287681 RepID=M7TJR8_EUTLA|nr:putative phenol 2-monooxygenase protein [Eutypa lata UCREL1]